MNGGKYFSKNSLNDYQIVKMKNILTLEQMQEIEISLAFSFSIPFHKLYLIRMISNFNIKIETG